MAARSKIFITLLFTILCQESYSQAFSASVAVDGLFDNREYKADMTPQTIYGIRIMPEVGFDYGKHRIMGGLSKIWEFGSDSIIKPDAICYYSYMGDKWSTSFGFIPRGNLQRQLPDAFLYDSIAFFEPVIGGTLIQYNGKWIQSELYCNWFSRQSDTRREAFRIIWDGYTGVGRVGAGWFASMTHFAKPKQPGHYIYDKMQLNPYLSVDLSGLIMKDLCIKAHAGVLLDHTRCRQNESKWYNTSGFLGDVQLRWRFLDVKHTVYAANSEQAFWNDPEAGLALHRSDPFYKHSSYNRTELGLTFVADRNVEIGFRWNIHHTPSAPIHNQQLITVRYRIGYYKQAQSEPQ